MIKLWHRFSGFVVTMMALAMPHRVRLLFARLLTYLSNPLGATLSVVMRKQARFWNNVILAVVFGLGIGSAALMVRGAQVFRRKPKGDTFWRPRESPETYIDRVGEPF